MDALKSAGVLALLGLAGVLAGMNIHAQNPPPAESAAADPLPNDVYRDSRNRLPLPKREDLDDSGKKAYDEWAGGLKLASINRAPLRLYSPKLAGPLGEAHLGLTSLGAVAANVVARAIARGVFAAKALDLPGAMRSWRDEFGR